MRSNKKKQLLVEGEADELFFKLCLQRAQLANQVAVGPPRTYGAKKDGKGNAISLLPKMIKQLDDGSLERVAIVVDADKESSGGLGYQQTFQKVKEAVHEYGFTNPYRVAECGFLFKHNNGLPELGLWIMPDNHSDGLLEDFVIKLAQHKDQDLLEEARAAVAKIKTQKFKPHHRSKAEAATWLAWQEIPCLGLHGALSNNLIDWSRPPAKPFEEWLKAVFR